MSWVRLWLPPRLTSGRSWSCWPTLRRLRILSGVDVTTEGFVTFVSAMPGDRAGLADVAGVLIHDIVGGTEGPGDEERLRFFDTGAGAALQASELGLLPRDDALTVARKTIVSLADLDLEREALVALVRSAERELAVALEGGQASGEQ